MDYEEIGLDVPGVKDAILEYIASILKNYQRFLIFPKEKKEFMSEYSNCFDTAPFLQYHKAKKPDSFLFHFVETGLFSRFIEDRLFSTDDYGS